MGGRGASSGMSKQGKKYGTEYETLHTDGKIKFVRYIGGNAKPPMETMTKGRIYGLVNQKDELRSLVFFDKNNRRHKQIDVSGTPHLINGKMELPHIHFGYNHNEKGDSTLSKHDKKLVDKASQSWYNYLRKK